jgi:hypothetical protein
VEHAPAAVALPLARYQLLTASVLVDEHSRVMLVAAVVMVGGAELNAVTVRGAKALLPRKSVAGKVMV